MSRIKNVYKNLTGLLKKPEYFFLATASFFGVLFIIAIPPLQTPDEHVHFYRAYEVSELSSNRLEQNGSIGSMLPASIAKTEAALNGEQQNPLHIQFNPYNKYDLRYTKHALLDIPLNQEEKDFYRTDGFPAIVYLPQSISVAIGKLFNSPVIVMLYMVRIANLLVWLAIAAFCIKLFPWKKWALVGVCLLPVVVAQTISPGLDVIAISAMMVFVTVILNGLYNCPAKLGLARLALLFLSGIVMVFAKSTLAIFLPLIFLLKNKQILPQYGSVFKAALLVVPVILFIIWTSSMTGPSEPSEVSSAGLQVSSLIHNPLHFVRLLFNTGFFETVSGGALAQSLVGYFGWLDTPIGPLFTYLGVALIAFILFVNTKDDLKKPISKKAKLLMLLTAIGLIIGSFLAMYLYSTLPGDNHIKGVQGRYLIPALIMLIPVCIGASIVAAKSTYVNVIRVGSIALLTVSVLTVIARYYFVFIPT